MQSVNFIVSIQHINHFLSFAVVILYHSYFILSRGFL